MRKFLKTRFARFAAAAALFCLMFGGTFAWMKTAGKIKPEDIESGAPLRILFAEEADGYRLVCLNTSDNAIVIRRAAFTSPAFFWLVRVNGSFVSNELLDAPEGTVLQIVEPHRISMADIEADVRFAIVPGGGELSWFFSRQAIQLAGVEAVLASVTKENPIDVTAIVLNPIAAVSPDGTKVVPFPLDMILFSSSVKISDGF